MTRPTRRSGWMSRRGFCAGALAALLPACPGRGGRLDQIIASDLFRRLALFQRTPHPSFPGADRYDPRAPALGTWPTPYGAAARNSRAGEPLVHRHWRVRWQAALEEARDPRSVLVGGGAVIVNGLQGRGFWDPHGRKRGGSGSGYAVGCYLDAAGQRLLAPDQDGLSAYTLPAGARDAAVLLPMLDVGSETEDILAGPDRALVFVIGRGEREAAHVETTVVTARARDYADIERGILRGLDPLAGVTRDGDRDVAAAAAQRGPVLAASDGIVWCDWQLRARAEFRHARRPIAMSIDDTARAWVIASDGGTVRLSLVPPGGPVTADVELPFAEGDCNGPPIIAPDGVVLLTPRNQILAFSPSGRQLWRQQRNGQAPGIVTADGLLLVADDQLHAITADSGSRTPLWIPPVRPTTSAVLASGLLHVATADTLFVLEPAATPGKTG